MSEMASQIISVSIVCLTDCSSADEENIKGSRYWPLGEESIDDWWILLTNGPVTRKMLPFDDGIMCYWSNLFNTIVHHIHVDRYYRYIIGTLL